VPVGFYEQSKNDPNKFSLLGRVEYGESTFLFAGDAEGELEDLFIDDLDTHNSLDCDFLKAGHHGSETSSSEDFIDLITPDIAVISCSERDVGSNKK